MGKNTRKQQAEFPANKSAGELDELYNRTGYLVRRVSQRATALFSEICPEITPRQYGAMLILSKVEGLDQKRLAELLHVDQTNIGIITRGLEKRGFIRRISGPSDKRKNILVVTESGTLSFNSIRKKAKKVDAALLANLSADEVRTLIHLLNKLLNEA